MNLGAWKIEKKEKKKVGGETSCCYGFNRSNPRPAILNTNNDTHPISDIIDTMVNLIFGCKDKFRKIILNE